MTNARSHSPNSRPRQLAVWLLLVAVLVFVMIVVGGITRLTESGLSIVQWKPVSGAIPPLGIEQWSAAFKAYQATPEGRLNLAAGMTLREFQWIFFWEYLHRLIGRLIGLGMLLPLIWFAIHRRIPDGYGWRLIALTALVALQGAIGWWMVASGLVDRTDVSHVRLAIHLLTALFFFGGLIWTACDLMTPGGPARLHGIAVVVFAIFGLQLLFGAFTAGLDAGKTYTSWPLMEDAAFPVGGWDPSLGLFGNIVDNPIVVQFIHRWWAWIAAAACLLLARRARPYMTEAPLLIGALMITQIAIGIATLLTGVAIGLGVAHQAVAALLLAAIVGIAHKLGTQS